MNPVRTALPRPTTGRLASLSLAVGLALTALQGQAAIFSDDEARRDFPDQGQRAAFCSTMMIDTPVELTCLTRSNT